MSKYPPKPTDRPANPRRKKNKAVPKNHIYDRPPIPKKGSRSAKVIHTAVGDALTAWEFLEMEYAGVFDVLMGVKTPSHASHRAYGAVMVSSTRREMLAAAAEAFFSVFPDTNAEKETTDVIKLHEKLAPRRNDIAHGIVQAFSSRLAHLPNAKETWCLFPAYTTTKAVHIGKEGRFPFEPKYAFTAQEIRRFAAYFRATRPAVAGLTETLRKLQKSPSTPITTVL